VPSSAPRSHAFRVGLLVASISAVTVPLALAFLPLTAWQADQPAANIARHLAARHKLEVDPASVLLRGGGSDLSPREAYFLARAAGDKHRDLYFAHVIVSARGIPVHASPAFALSRTSLADEQELRYDGERFLAYASAVEGKTSTVTILDLDGLSQRALADFSGLQRLQQRLTNWQETGRLRGLDRVEVELTVPRPLSLAWQGGLLHASGKDGAFEVVVDARQAKVLRGPAQARVVRIGKRSFIAWAVDTVRNFSFIGPDKIAWLEDKFYGVIDRARRISGASISAVEIKDEMALPVVAAGGAKIEGWPPPRLRPILGGALKGEGEWVEVKGPFLRAEAGQPSYFAMTFLRPDAERLFARVYFVAWDPRRLDLRMVGGTAEPRSATGELGRGVIPRDPKLLPRVVAAFNGGFQSMHGDFGMMEERRVYCPPKPWAATVARLADGATGFGTWDGNAKAGWTPEWISSFRQNLTPLVEDSQFNPWKRGSWGGGAGFLTGSGPTAYIIRSGLCLHASGHVMYVLGNPVDGPTLGKAMQRAGCNYGMELDINSGHVGFEFFNVLRAGETEPEGFVEEKYFARHGTYPGVDSLRYFMREVVRGTGNSPVPRYLGREARDFFYLVARDTLPGPDLAGAGKEAGRWTSAALPPAALRFPQAMTRAFVLPGGASPAKKERRVHVVKLDLRWLEPTLCLPKGDAGCLGPAATAPAATSTGTAAAGTGTAMPAAAAPERPLAVLPLGDFGPGRALVADGKALAGTAGASASLVLRPRRPEGPALPAVAARPDAEVGSISVQGASSAALAGPAGRPLAAVCALPAGKRTDSLDEVTLLYASGIGASAEELRAALAAAGCREPVLLGHAEPLVLAKDGAGGFQTIFGDVFPPLATTPALVLRRSRASFGPRIFTHVKVQPRSVWTAAQPERTRASALHHAKKTAAELGLPPPKSLDELCRAPYAEVKELRQYRYRDPLTGRTCGADDGALVGKGKRKVKATPAPDDGAVAPVKKPRVKSVDDSTPTGKGKVRGKVKGDADGAKTVKKKKRRKVADTDAKPARKAKKKRRPRTP